MKVALRRLNSKAPGKSSLPLPFPSRWPAAPELCQMLTENKNNPPLAKRNVLGKTFSSKPFSEHAGAVFLCVCFVFFVVFMYASLYIISNPPPIHSTHSNKYVFIFPNLAGILASIIERLYEWHDSFFVSNYPLRLFITKLCLTRNWPACIPCCR